MSRVLAVDPGDVRLGLAISDPGASIARPFDVLKHTSRKEDARRIVELARREGVEVIVVGVALDSEGRHGASAQRGVRLAEALRQAGFPAVVTADESGSTRAALDLHPPDRLTDARAAAVVLQEYLDARPPT
jgi:putative Holliday junction resolvase